MKREGSAGLPLESPHFFQTLIERSLLGIYLVREGRFAYLNPRTEDIVGRSMEELVGKSFLEVIHPDDHARVLERYRKRVEGKAAIPQYRFRVVRPDGEIRWVEIYAQVLPGTEPPLVVGNVLDVTDEVRMEEDIRRVQEKFNEILSHLPEGVYELFYDGRQHHWELQFMNTTFLHWMGSDAGRSPAERFQRFLEKIHPEDRPRYHHVLETLQKGDTFTLEYRFHSNGREEIWIQDRLFRPGGSQNDTLLGVARDITRRKRLELMLEESRRLETVGRLAGGMAHHFNNLLTVILGHVELLLGEEGLSEPVRNSLEEIRKAAKRGADLVDDLRVELTQEERTGQVDNLPAFLESFVRTFRAEVPPGISIELDCAREHYPPVAVSPKLMQKMLARILHNIVETLEEGGRIRVRLGELEPILTTGRQGVLLSIQDTGTGVPPDMIPYVFEPFLGSRMFHRRTLGLYAVYHWLLQLGGEIELVNDSAQHTTVRIRLPVVS